jgi:hypothetical protein
MVLPPSSHKPFPLNNELSVKHNMKEKYFRLKLDKELSNSTASLYTVCACPFQMSPL